MEEKKPKKRILPNPKGRQSFEEASAAINKQYAWTLAKLAGIESPESMGIFPQNSGKRILPKSGGRRETLEESLKAIHKQYGETLARLAALEEAEKLEKKSQSWAQKKM